MALLLAAAPAGATVIGLSDQNAPSFTDELFGRLGIRDARLVVPWNAIWEDPGPLRAWMKASARDGIDPLVAFEHASSDRCPGSPCVAPTAEEYARAFADFRRAYPWVHLVEPWNEANHPSQPTADDPALAARYYGLVVAACPGCTVLAADVLDAAGVTRWLTDFLAA